MKKTSDGAAGDSEGIKLEKEPTAPETITLSTFVAGVVGSDTLKVMFAHYAGLAGAHTPRTKEAFEAEFETFKGLTVDQLK